MIGCGELDGHQASLRGLSREPATCGTTRVLEKSGDFKASKAPDDVDEAARSPTPNGLSPINDRVGMPQERVQDILAELVHHWSTFSARRRRR
jgi:hypothetical protein